MVLKPTKLPPNKKSVEEVVLARKLNAISEPKPNRMSFVLAVDLNIE